ncbi:MAG TPA: S-methyl-5'-thioadenosine phosphorylase [Holophagaceae bacterium]|nr:S-methyl-5'-thioadenosine phosphorylase [Holophagaceae bacterium]
MTAPIGILGGSGLYGMPGVVVAERREVTTPFGAPSGPVVLGTLEGVPVAFLPRHGEGHRLTPSEVNYRANVWALKQVGVEILLSVSAVGSLQAHLHPGTLCVPTQFMDKTHLRASTFFGEGLVAHVGFAEPTSAWLRGRLQAAAARLGLALPEVGTYVNMEGPQFSTRAESRLHQAWGADLIGMTQATEAKLAREAELVWACIALVTDFDAWKDDEAVETHDVLAVMAANVDKAQSLLRAVVQDLAAGAPTDEPARHALKFALMTQPAHVPAATAEKLRPLVGRYGY